MKYTNNQKINAELSLRSLSEKAERLYIGSDRLMVYEIETEEGKRYDVTGDIMEANGLTFEELDKAFSELQEEFDRLAEEDEEA